MGGRGLHNIGFECIHVFLAESVLKIDVFLVFSRVLNYVLKILDLSTTIPFSQFIA
jgi:hypothetical protein